MGGFPSGQRGQTVNLLQIASVVRIHLHPLAQAGAVPQGIRWYGGIGRRKGLKIPRGQPRAGSSPATSTILNMGETLNLQRFSCFILWPEMYVLVCFIR